MQGKRYFEINLNYQVGSLVFNRTTDNFLLSHKLQHIQIDVMLEGSWFVFTQFFFFLSDSLSTLHAF